MNELHRFSDGERRIIVIAADDEISIAIGPDDIYFSVGYDYTAAGQLATKYLIDKGHRRIAFIGARIDRPSRGQMLEGYCQALENNGIEKRDDLIWLSDTEAEGNGVYEIENGHAAAKALIEQPLRPTACVCLNDMTALGAMEAFRSSGIDVPEEMSVVGFDNITFSGLLSPGLTTVDQHADEMGRAAVRMFIEKMKDSSVTPANVNLKPELIVRGSVSCPPQIDDPGNTNE